MVVSPIRVHVKRDETKHRDIEAYMPPRIDPLYRILKR